VVIDWNGPPYPDRRGPIALCRCGQSNRKPFCDGTHRTCGFVGDAGADAPAERLNSIAAARADAPVDIRPGSDVFAHERRAHFSRVRLAPSIVFGAALGCPRGGQDQTLSAGGPAPRRALPGGGASTAPPGPPCRTAAVLRAGAGRGAAMTAGVPGPMAQPAVSRPQVAQRSISRRGCRANESSWPKSGSEAESAGLRGRGAQRRQARRYRPSAGCGTYAGATRPRSWRRPAQRVGPSTGRGGEAEMIPAVSDANPMTSAVRPMATLASAGHGSYAGRGTGPGRRPHRRRSGPRQQAVGRPSPSEVHRHNCPYPTSTSRRKRSGRAG
jgi:CDGSH-type Zn-finger protein